MTSHEDATYRLRMAQGFLQEARQDVDLGRWRSAVDNSQLAVEHAAKAVLALLGPVGRTHTPAAHLRQALDDGRFQAPLAERVRALAEKSEWLGADVHIQTDYGDEVGGRTPWELFDEADARRTLGLAEEAVVLAQSIIQQVSVSPQEEGKNRKPPSGN
jgi:HEPN domain-containing protein